ncbi:uncharacterized protein B0I36DRAFT_410598 [Microdochium trichocladiopsis]|uniref:Fungal-specific transcription factor domain-domain-containing protein n=1 Tax=Microdochium trichocladiopsis TaxID=1682393 RepID=A0A9P9BSL4_9PEZI|nr:uncharacterized protein B0I36DRAFT_410598 [Microdochium trichocladiopsis]KAH7028961.1 hypothetical protein B0I36DRAFT_410598 [Microdochium trichocladiopsis]
MSTPDGTGDTDRAQKPLICGRCGCRFSRPSHLRRHQQTHLPLQRKSLSPCPQCGRTFSRKDVLLRHLRGAHQVHIATKQSAQRSCFHCVDKKLRCDRGRPCQSCCHAGAECSYVGSRPLAEDDGIQLGQELTSCPSFPEMPPSPLELGSRSPALDTPDSTTGTGTLSQPSSIKPRFAGNPCALSDQRDLGLHTPFAGATAKNIDYLGLGSASAMPSLGSLVQPDLLTSAFNWLDFDVPDMDIDDSVIIPDPSLSPVAVWSEYPAYLNSHRQESPTQQPPAYLCNANQSAAPRESVGMAYSTRTARNGPLSRAREPQQPTQSWPFDQAQDLLSQRYLLPPLREVLENTYRSDLHGRDAALRGLVHLFSEPYLPDPKQHQDAVAAQATALLRRLLDLYFAKFHNIQPIIHLSTWEMTTCPTVLLAAMACVGALLSNDPPDHDLATSLGEICLPLITWHGSQRKDRSDSGNAAAEASQNRLRHSKPTQHMSTTSANYGDISYLNAMCLHQIYSLGSGNRQLYQNADRSRGNLIGSLRGMGLLSSNLAVGNHSGPGTNTLSQADPSTLYSEWSAWISREQERRTAWASFEYDCSLCTLTSRRGAVDLGELPLLLPCSEALWDAPSPQVWVALRSRATRQSFGPALFPIIKATLAGNKVPEYLGTWAKRLCCQVIGRLLWDLKQLEIIAMPERFGLKPLLNAHEQSKSSLLSALDNLLGSMDAPRTTAELISYNISGLLCHYSHLYAAEDIMDIVVYIVRKVISQDPRDGPDLESARRRLRSAFSRDAPKARKLVWHAAQIVATANEYLVSAPCEIMRVFMGYIYIIAFAEHGPPTGEAAAAAADQAPGVRLDIPNHHDAGTEEEERVTIDIARWIEHGGPAGLGRVSNLCRGSGSGCVSLLSQDAQAMLSQLSCWGLAGKFIKILQTLASTGI